MKIEDYYEQVAEDMRKQNEYFEKHPEERDRFFETYVLQKDSKRDDKMKTAFSPAKGWTTPARNPYASPLNTSCNQESVLTRSDFINTIGEKVSNYLGKQNLTGWTDKDFDNLAEQVFREIESVKEHYRLDH